MSFGVVLTAPAYCSKACVEWAQQVGYRPVNKGLAHDSDSLARCNELPLQRQLTEFQFYSVAITTGLHSKAQSVATKAHDTSWCLHFEGRLISQWQHDKSLQSPQSVYAGCKVCQWALHSTASAHESLKAREADHCCIANDCNDCILGDPLRPQSSWKRGWHVPGVALAIGQNKKTKKKTWLGPEPSGRRWQRQWKCQKSQT